MMPFILIIMLLASIGFGAITTLPAPLILLLCYAVVFKRSWVFALAFFTGLFLDIIFVRILGQTSTSFLIFIFIVFLYERKFEIQSKPFVFFAAFLGSIGYLLVFGYNHVLEQSLASSLIAVLLFNRLNKFKVQS